jgi:membrane protein YdbS with pleckstrin-like domain
MGYTDERKQREQDKKYEKMGEAVAWISWIIYAVKFLVTVTVISGIVLFIMNKPLWIAPIIALGLLFLYRLICRLLIMIARWARNE